MAGRYPLTVHKCPGRRIEVLDGDDIMADAQACVLWADTNTGHDDVIGYRAPDHHVTTDCMWLAICSR